MFSLVPITPSSILNQGEDEHHRSHQITNVDEIINLRLEQDKADGLVLHCNSFRYRLRLKNDKVGVWHEDRKSKRKWYSG